MIKEKLDEYLEFDSSFLFKRHPSSNNHTQTSKMIRIFGGAIIANQPINDIDILCGSRSLLFLNSSLEYMGFHYMEDLIHKDISSLYKDIKVICEPHTWVKGNKLVQVIRPSFHFKSDKSYKESFTDLISNVDISCCGLSYDGDNLYENYPNAIIHCQNKVFSVNRKAKMYSYDRITLRKNKLSDRGWTEIDDNVSDIRNQKIENLFHNNQNIEFIAEYVNSNYQMLII